MIIATETGMRCGEPLGLRWCDVSHNRRVVGLKMTKNGTSREMILSYRAFEALCRWRESAENTREHVLPMTVSAPEQAWRRLLARSGMKDLRFHDLRREAISWLFERGLSNVEVAAISGHKELRMLARYTHLSADDLIARVG